MHTTRALRLGGPIAAALLCACSVTHSLDDLVGSAEGGAGSGGGAGAGGLAGAGGGSGGIPGVSAKAPLRRIAAGGSHVCIVDSTDRVFCWGSNSNGQLGTGGPPDGVIRPTQVGTVNNVGFIIAGNFHSCAFGPSGSWCWGKGTQGELGDGKLANSGLPVSIDLGSTTGIKTAAAGASHTCAIVGTPRDVLCWGNNTNFQSSSTGAPSNVPLPTKTTQSGQFTVAGGAGHTCIAAAAGRAKCWGENTEGQLGDGTQSNAVTPLEISLTADVTQLSSRSKHTCAIDKSGELYCWGWNATGQVGNGKTSATEPTPTKVLLGATPIKPIRVSAGNDHTCAVQAGKAYCWGGNAKGQLGTGDTTTATSPTEVSLPAGTVVFDVAAGISFSCALTLPQGNSEADSVYCWGNNASGQVGTAVSASELTPVKVAL